MARTLLETHSLLGRRVYAPETAPAQTPEEAWHQLLAQRGMTEEAAIRRFLHPRLGDLPHPKRLVDAERAAERLADAILAGELIHIFGDFDCDGVAGTALLAQTLTQLGAQVSWSVPHRADDGHGVPAEEVRQAAGRGVRVGVCVDTGSAAWEAAEAARAHGIDLIVCDHHELPEALPEVFALINPMRSGCGFAERVLCGTGVAFFLLIALRSALRVRGHVQAEQLRLADGLPLVALATVADVMPLIEANRILVARGLAEMRARPPLWLQALAKAARLDLSRLTSHAIAFQLAPRINAAGRMRHGKEAVHILLSSSMPQALELARQLDEDNRTRRRIQDEVARAAMARLPDDAPAFAACDAAWHAGVLGLAAGVIARMRGRPAAIGRVLPDGRVHFSARAPEGWQLNELLTHCAEHLERHGGHAGAGGGTVKPGQWAAFCEAWQAAALKMRAGPVSQQWQVDANLCAQAVQLSLADWLQRFEPTGRGNPVPLWRLVDARIVQRREMRNESFAFSLAGGLQAVLFRAPKELAEALQQAEQVQLIGRIERNDWNGTSNARFVIEDAIIQAHH